MNTKPSEFDAFTDQLPEDVAESLHFIPVREDKAADVPKEEDLKKEKYWLSLEEARERLKSGKNVGPVLRDQLSIFVVMDLEEAQAYLEELPPTLKVSTRGEEIHLYYLCGDGIESKDIPGIAELRTGNRYVVAPGSYASDENGENWGTYTVKEARKVAKITLDDLPEELRPRKKLGKEGNVNKYGWRIENIREEDGVLDALLTREKPPLLGFISKEDADAKTIEKLLYWEFSPGTITSIMKEYRDCDEVDSLYTEVFTEFQDANKAVVSDVKNVKTFRPGSKQEERSARLKKNLERWVFDDDRASWSCDTEFVTFTTDIKLPSGRTVRKGETYELPSDLAEKLSDREEAGRFVWYCEACGEGPIIEDEPEERRVCPNPSCGKKALSPLHPTKPNEVEDVLLDNYHFATIQETNRTRKAPKIHRYEGGRYIEPGTEGMIKKIIKNKILPDSPPHFRNRVFKNIVDSTAHLEEEFGIGEHEEKVVVGNGVLNLDTLELSGHDPELLALARVEANYKPDEDCPKFKKLLKDTIPKEEERRRLQELLGTALVNRKDHKEIFILVGKTDTGKSTILKIIERVFGEENISNETITKLANSKWRIANLRGVLLNISHEVSSGSIKREEDLKAIWDGDWVSVEEKGVQPYEIRPTCEHIFAANTTPQADRSDEAFWNRVFVAVSEGRVPKSEQDPDLHEKIAEKESSGILNWIVEGYRRVVDNDGFTTEQSETESADRWLNWGDSIARFLHNCVEYEEGSKITTDELHDLFAQYVDAHEDLEMKSQTTLTKRAKKLPYAKYSDQFRFGGKKRSGFKHITVKLEEGQKTSQRVSKTSLQSFQKGSDTGEKEEKVPPGNDGGTFSFHAGEKEETETEKIPQRVSKKSLQSFQNRDNVNAQVTEKFVYEDETFEEGDELVVGEDLPKDVAEDAIEKGYIKCADKGKSTEFPDTPSQRDKIQALRKIIREIAEDYGGDVPISAIVEEAKGEGIAPGFVEEFVERSLRKGELIPTEKDGERAVRFND